MEKKQPLIMVGMADLNSCKHPGGLTTLGLGSCVGIALYDPQAKVAGLAHCMLPDSSQIQNNANKAKFVDTAVVTLVSDMLRLGASRARIIAKVAGGAQMFAVVGGNEKMRIGDRNVEATEAILKRLGIRIISMDVRENYGRTVELFTEDGRFVIKTIGRPIKTI